MSMTNCFGRKWFCKLVVFFITDIIEKKLKRKWFTIQFRFFLGRVRSGLFWNGNTFILKILPLKRILWRTEKPAPLPLPSVQSRSVAGISNRGTSLLGGDEEGKDYHFFSFKVDKSWEGSVKVKCLNWYCRQFYLGTGLIVIGLKGLKNIKGRRHFIS